LCYFNLLIFFFSSRRRHTRSKRDWSSDVCSSDFPKRYHCSGTFDVMQVSQPTLLSSGAEPVMYRLHRLGLCGQNPDHHTLDVSRSEERRVGKKCSERRRWE